MDLRSGRGLFVFVCSDCLTRDIMFVRIVAVQYTRVAFHMPLRLGSYCISAFLLVLIHLLEPRLKLYNGWTWRLSEADTASELTPRLD